MIKHFTRFLEAVSRPEDKEQYAEFLRERIYGGITLLALNTGLVLNTENITATYALTTVLITIIGLWAASLFAEVTAYRVVHDHAMPRQELLHIIIAHRGILITAIPSVFFISLSIFHVIDLKSAFIADILLGLTAMLIIIIRSAKTAENSFHTTFIAVLLQIVIAVFIIGAKILIH